MMIDEISIKDSSLTGDKACLKIREHFDKEHEANSRLNDHKIKLKASNARSKENNTGMLRETELRHTGEIKETHHWLPQFNLTIVDKVP